MALHDPALRALYDLKVGTCSKRVVHAVIVVLVQVFVQCDSDLMLARRLQRDVKERGRNVDGILDQSVDLPNPVLHNT
jgi:uridine kinase